MILTEDNYADITPRDYEIYVKSLFEKFDNTIQKTEILHDIKERTSDSNR